MNDDLERAIREATTPRPDAIKRVRQRVLGKVTTASSSRALLRRAPGAETAAVERVRRRVLSFARRSTPVGQRWPIVGLAVLAAAAAATLFAVRWNGGERTASLESLSDWQVAALDARTQVRFQGYGAVHTIGRTSEITWEYGTLQVEVEPDSGTQLVVETREGTVRVVGTVFSVQRDALGTAVHVHRGVVQVECASGPSTFLQPTQRGECLPTTAAGLLGRARALADTGAHPGRILSTVETGLARSTDIATSSELTALRIELLGESGRHGEALEHAEAYLASDNPLRRTQVRRMAARLALEVGGCTRARTHLEALAAQPEPDPSDLHDLARCEPTGSARQRGLLRRAADMESAP